MSRHVNATIVTDDSLFSAIEGEAKEVVFEYRINTPFSVSKEHKPDHEEYDKDENDVVVYGPVYVGDDKMLDRHKELVAPQAIMDSWQSYSKNPVILYNHRKDYGVIGMMEEVEMGEYEKPDGTKIQAVFGRARIDSGEEAIVRKIRKGMLKAFSIGFIAKGAIKEGRGDDAYLKFTNIEWIETSVVDIPASPNALFNVSKSLVSYDGEKHVIAVEERDGSYVIEFGKSEDVPDEPAPPMEETELALLDDSIEDVVELLDAIAGLEAKLADLESRIDKPIEGDTVKTHDENHDVMTEAEIAEETNDEVEETVELSAPEETFTIKSEDHIKSEDLEEEAEEEVLEEELEEAEEAEEEVLEEAEEEVVEAEVVEEVLEEELVEEVAEATEEESNDEPVETKDEEVSTEVAVLSEVVNGLTAVESKVSDLIARLDDSESLKTLLAEKDAEIATLTETLEANAKQAEFDEAVEQRVAERLAEEGVKTAPASPKSLSPVPTDVLTKKDVTGHDPQPQVSKGMAHLGAWLEGRLGGRRLE